MDNEEKIWNYLYSYLKNEYGTAGLMGNLKAESNLNPKNLQDTFNLSLGLSDEEYTRKVDDGTYTNFVHDGAGYGLAQYTWWSRKQQLLNYAKSKNKSIGDLNVQLEFLLKELTTTFPGIAKILTTTNSVEQASNMVLMQFEQPYNMEALKAKRLEYSMNYYNKYKKGETIKVGTNIYMKGSNTPLSQNVSSNEMDCQGHGCCNQTKINSKLVDYIQKIRDHFQKPITITSGYRCPTHNSNVGGATGSRHSVGDAADIVVKDVAPAKVAAYAEEIGIKGIGLYETSKDGFFTHIDTRDYKSFWYGQAQAPRSTFALTAINTTSMPTASMLQLGSKGADVKALQEKLVKLGYELGTIDGDFGNKTLQAVKKFQTDHNLANDGLVGPATIAALADAIKLLTNNDKKVKVIADLLNVRQEPNTNSSIIARAPQGTQLTVVEEKDGWSKLSIAGWVCSQYVMEV